MSDYDLYGNAHFTEQLLGAARRGVVLTHSFSQCDGSPCPIHNPSDHPLNEAEMVVRMDRAGLVERVCEHGVGHPDPDSVAYLSATRGDDGWGVHGCDGCCSR